MLINDSREHPTHVKFISYTGKWPSLCVGILTLEINGEIVTFGDQGRYDAKLPNGSQPAYPKFWSTGGTCPMPPEELTRGSWRTDVGQLPEKYKAYAEEIDAALNQNVEFGCCGGCR